MISFHFNHNFLLADESMFTNQMAAACFANDERDHGGDQRLTLCMLACG